MPLRRLGIDPEEDSGKNGAKSSRCSLRTQEAQGLEGPGPGRSRMKQSSGLDVQMPALTSQEEGVYSLEKGQSEGLLHLWAK